MGTATLFTSGATFSVAIAAAPVLCFRHQLEMATAQRTRPRAVVGAPRRAAWQLKSALRHSVSAAPRTIIFLHFFYNYCW